MRKTVADYLQKCTIQYEAFGKVYNTMKRSMARVVFWVVVIIMIIIGAGLLIVHNKVRSYPLILRSTIRNLRSSRESIRLFFEQTGRFPESLQEMNEYAKKGEEYRDKIEWRSSPKEFISSKHPPNTSEHSVLDDTGGLYYNPKTGVLKVNLTKPLKSYWKFYSGERKEEVPAEW